MGSRSRLMPRARAHISLEDKLASALYALGFIPYADAMAMGRSNFLSLWHYDHSKRHAEDGEDEFWNLTPLLIPQHRIKTATIDIPQIAKNKRIRNKEAVRRYNEAAKLDPMAAAELYPIVLKARRKRAIQNRPFPKQQRPLRSRNTFQRGRP